MSTQLILGLLGAVGTLGCAVWALTVTVRLKSANGQLALLSKALAEANAATTKANANLSDDAARYEKLISFLKEEVVKREKLLDASTDPAVLRARLDSLLASASRSG